ncbi:MAG: LamG-like jellyroll fold domain-containing protein [Thermoguttaceae bacterium]|jgi:hypothetical protein|nr:LamG-like jellyroll fold domain-containing protein [Thermoguttaceae bacterium]
MFKHSAFGRALPALFLSAFMALPAHAALIAAYGHENPENRLQDDTGNGHTLTKVGAVTFIDAPEQPGFHYFKLGETVAQYSGSRHLQVPDGAYPQVEGAGGSFTFTGLVNCTGAGGFQTILSADRFRFQRRLIDGNPGLNISIGGIPSNNHWAAADFALDTWYFVALRYDQPNNSLTAFIDSASDTWDPTTHTVSVLAAFNDLQNLTLGRNMIDTSQAYYGPDNWTGMIDSARFYTTALSDSELAAVFFQFSVPEPSAFALVLLALCGLLLRRNR